MIDVRVVEKQTDNGGRGPFRALYDWLTGAAPQPAPMSETTTASRDLLPARIGHYAIAHKLGEGGMGVVYAARDDRLGRTVALKMVSSLANDDTARQRLWREARAAASVNHPNVCQIYEIAEDGGELYIAMELLEGEALGERLRRGAMSPSEALPIAFDILAALSALHTRGIVHRDLKPSNVFLTKHGVKLLDFGLARPDGALDQDSGLTRTGIVMGTPRYMAPEQVSGEDVDGRTDLFAAGAILFEMLAGRPAFGGRTVAEVLHATQYEQPPALAGSPTVTAIDRVIRRALAKRPADRPISADVMADELRAVPEGAGERDATTTLARAFTRLVVLPFRVLRPDPETDFLAFSLPDAIATSLSSNASLILRSSAAAARFAGDAPDLKALAAEADVDRVVMGTLLRSGDQLRAAAQLVEAPAGTLITSHTVQASLGDLFRLQDDIAQRVAEALSLPLSGVSPHTPDAPHDARAYELYLRGNELARTYDGMPAARDHYQHCLDLDPRFAPAWARLGRCHRVIGKYIDPAADSEARAEQAFRRALALSPRLSIAHKYYANLEADIGKAQDALVRLLGEASRHGNDPELFAGLVHACRYCGLFEQSIAAHAEARRLDPNVPTSVEQTLLMTGDVDRLLAFATPGVIAGADDGIRAIGLGLAGRREEARQKLFEMRHSSRIPLFEAWIEYLLLWIDRRVPEMLERRAARGPFKIEEDPEAMFQEGWLSCDVGEYGLGLTNLQQAVAKGYFVAPTLAERPQFDPLRSDPAFQSLLRQAEEGRQRALAAFHAAGGERLLGS